MIKVRPLGAEELRAAIPQIARLRITVFRDWPYLYDGDMAYEEAYLRPYLESAQALVVGAFDGDRLVGASNAAPLADHAEDFAAAFAGTEYDFGAIFYGAESVLLPEYRGQGVGHRFFDLRESHARAAGFAHVAFCSVVRPEDHPARPAGYRPLDAFWRGRGYAPLEGVIAQFHWKDVGEAEETAKPLQFWMKTL